MRAGGSREQYAASNGFLTLLSGGERLSGVYALGPEAPHAVRRAFVTVLCSPQAAVP